MKVSYFFLLLTLSFYAFSPRVIGQREDSLGGKGIDEALGCPEEVIPELSREVVQWLFGRIPYEENMDAAEACLYAHMDRAGIQGASGHWRVALCRGALGAIALKRSQPLLAVEHFEAFHQAAVELPKSSSSREAKHAQICLGRALSVAQQHDEALAHYLSGIDSLWVSDVSECPYLVLAVEDAIAIYEQKGYWLKVGQYAEQLISYYSTPAPVVDTASLIYALVRAGRAYARLGSEAAQSYLDRAREWVRVFSGPKGHYEAMLRLASTYLQIEKEQYSRATRNALQVQKWSEENAGDVALLAEAYLLLATLAQRQGALKLAEKFLHRYRLLNGLPPLVQSRFEVWSLDIKGQLLKAKGDLSGAQALLHIALPEPADSTTLEWAGLLTRRAQLYAEASQWDTAEAALQKAIEIIYQHTSSDTPRIARLHLMLGEWYSKKGDLDKSKLYIKLVESLLKAPSHQTYSTRLLWVDALEVKARAHLIRYDKDMSAAEALYAATDVLKEAQKQIAELGQQAKTVEQCLYLDQRLRRISELHIKAALLQYECDGDICHLEEAFEVAQRSKDFMSLVLIASLDRRQEKQKDSLIISATPSQYAVCLEKVAKYRHLIQGDTVNVGNLLQVAGELAEAEEVYRSYLEHFPISNYSPVESERMIRRLYRREAVLDYFVGHETLYVFILQKGGPIQITTVPLNADTLVRTIESLMSAVSGRHSAAQMQLFYKPAYRLYNQLFRPIEDLLRDRVDLIGIIPDQDLFKIPFAALIRAEPPVNQADRVAEYSYLMKKYAFYYAYSVNHWLISREAKEPPNRPKVVIMKLRDPQLKAGDEEVKQIRKLIGGTIIGDAIGKEQFFDRIGEVHIAHYIGHGSADSGAVLAWKGRGANGPENIYAPDVLKRSFSTLLLTLSACSAARPSYKQAYALSMTKAFGYAGVAGVMGADWGVEDSASSAIMIGMYRQLLKRRTRSKAHALQSAQQACLESSSFAHPCCWAGFKIFGNNERFDHPDRRKIRRATKRFNRILQKGLIPLPSNTP